MTRSAPCAHRRDTLPLRRTKDEHLRQIVLAQTQRRFMSEIDHRLQAQRDRDIEAMHTCVIPATEVQKANCRHNLMRSSPITSSASFTDDTSLPRVPFVSIHAQVLVEACELGWLELMRNMLGAAPGGEFKKAAVDFFFSQSFGVQLSLLQSIGSQARIHIVDPRPRIAGLGSAIRRWLPNGVDLLRFCKGLEASTAHLEGVREVFNDGVAESILYHSPAQQHLMTLRALEYSGGLRINPYLVPDNCGFHIEKPAPLSSDIEPFRKKRANVIGQVTEFVSASASVFTPATDHLRATDSPARRWGASNALCASHAFDEGDRQQLDHMEDQRDEVIGKTRSPFYFMRAQPLTEIKSDNSPHVQAADIAAGVARELWSRFNLVQIARHFHYVTYNSVRLSAIDAIYIQEQLDHDF